MDAALTDWRRFDLPASGVSAFRQGQTVSIPPSEPPGTVRIYAAGLGFLGLGAIEAGGPLGAAATYFVRDSRIELEGGCRDAYNARLLKRSKLLIEV